MAKLCILIFLLFFPFLMAEDKRNSIISRSGFGKNIGVFVNGGTEEFEIDGYIDANMDFGLFADIWFSQVDFDQNSDIELNTSLGYLLEITKNFSAGIGYSKFSYLGDDQSFKNDEGEFFFGAVIGPATGLIFLDYEFYKFDYMCKIDLNHGPLKKIPIDIFLQGYFEQENFDINISFIKRIKDHFTLGYILSREKYDDIQTRSFVKNGQNYTIDFINNEQGIFHKIYAGLVF